MRATYILKIEFINNINTLVEVVSTLGTYVWSRAGTQPLWSKWTRKNVVFPSNLLSQEGEIVYLFLSYFFVLPYLLIDLVCCF